MTFLFHRVFKKTNGNGGVSLHSSVCLKWFCCFKFVVILKYFPSMKLDETEATVFNCCPFLSSCLTADPLPWKKRLCWQPVCCGQSWYVPSSLCVFLQPCSEDKYIIDYNVMFTDGVVKLDSTNFGDRKGNIIKCSTLNSLKLSKRSQWNNVSTAMSWQCLCSWHVPSVMVVRTWMW